MKNELDDFLGTTEEKDTTDPFSIEPEEVFKEKPVEAEEETEDDEDKLPFNKNPKVQRYIDKQIEKRLKDVKPTEVETFKEEIKDELAAISEEIIGNDTPEKRENARKLRTALETIEKRSSAKVFEQLQAEQDRTETEDRQAQEELADGFDNVENTFGVDLTSRDPKAVKVRNEFIDFITLVAPKDEDGEVTQFPDLVETFRLYQGQGKRGNPTASRAKQLSARGMDRSADASNTAKPVDNSWKAVERMLGK